MTRTAHDILGRSDYIFGYRTGCLIALRLASNFIYPHDANIPEPPCLVTTNHLSYWDALCGVVTIPHRTSAVAAEKLKKNPFTHTFVGKWGTGVFVNQESADIASIKDVLTVIKAGYVMVIGPEGHRSKTGQLLPARDGAAFIARKANVPIVPMSFVGTNRILKEPRPRVEVRVGKAYTLPEPTQRGKAQLQEDSDRIMCAIAALLPPEMHGHYANHPLIDEMRSLVTP